MSNNILIEFLQNILKEIESDELSDSNLQLVSKFYMEYKFNTNQGSTLQSKDKEDKEDKEDKDNTLQSEDKDDLEDNKENDFNDKELMQFVVLGWYMYQMMKKID